MGFIVSFPDVLYNLFGNFFEKEFIVISKPAFNSLLPEKN
jgi:hypothetical protein